MTIQIPEVLQDRLSQDRAIEGAVKATVSRFEEWLAHSRMPFFPEFTDHGPEHLSNVLGLSEFLVTKDGDLSECFTAADVGLLTLSILLHDLGMHLTEDGFLRLLDKVNPWPRIESLDSLSWQQLWTEFCSEAQRWDDRTLAEHFGEASDQQPEQLPMYSPPDQRCQSTWTDLDQRFIGEFIRRNHPRIAHEIARFGVPGPKADRLKLSLPDNFIELGDLAGFVARSHGQELRSCFDYLKKHYELREFRGTHPVFAMALLRIADYLDLVAERAPQSIQLVQERRSPRSKREWQIHQAIRSISVGADEDPESLRLHVKPPNIRVYLDLSDLLANIQRELDQTWAVLGEIFGRFQDFWLSIRRIKSNLTNRDFQSSLQFLPERIDFGVARSEILGLLVQPLYGSDTRIGIRELLQNSIDAVRELSEIKRQNPQEQFDVRKQPTDILVRLFENESEKDEWWLEVSDQGVGMTPEIVRDYFLKAGASFRDSIAWKREFEREPGKDGKAAKSRVLRTGRFGIGAFATFLIGEELQVETRHYSQPRSGGLAFRASLKTSPIEIERKELGIGTCIRIALDRNTFLDLSRSLRTFRWYHLAYPEIGYELQEIPGLQEVERPLGVVLAPIDPHDLTICKHSHHIPDPKSELPRAWHRLNVNEALDVIWSYGHDDDVVILNGFYLNSMTSAVGYNSLLSEFQSPAVAISDPDGEIPINLTRDEFTRTPSFFDVLEKEVAKSYFAFLLSHGPESWSSLGSLLDRLHFAPFGPFKNKRSSLDPVESSLLLMRSGFTLPTKEAVRDNKVRHLAVIGEGILYTGHDDEILSEDSKLKLDDGQGLYRVKKIYAEETDPMAWISEVYGNYVDFLPTKPIGARFLGKAPIEEPFHELPIGPSVSFEDFRIEWMEGGWYSVVGGTPGKSLFTEDFLTTVEEIVALYQKRGYQLSLLPPFLGEFFLDGDSEGEGHPMGMKIRDSLGRLWEFWLEILRKPMIPYEKSLRELEFKFAYQELREYLTEHEARVRGHGYWSQKQEREGQQP